jgi:ribosomal protein S21|tara:strand:+ start:143 stop:379 length:237 start_codon:yes stop_codon:yes gene_type:complete
MNKQSKHHKSIVPGNAFSTKVIGKDINFAIRNWKKQTKTSGILDILKSKQEFQKASILKRQMLSAAKYKQYIQTLKED